jgi:thymidylate synthase
MKEINKVYLNLLKQLIKAPKVGNTHEINNVKITFKNDYSPTVMLAERNLSKSYIIGELVWYLIGSNNMKRIAKFSNFWTNISDDGKTSNSAYGYLIHKKYDFDQLNQIVKILKVDPLSRRAVINLNYAHSNKLETKDEICTLALQFMIRNKKLNMTSIMRSNDIWFGFPYDIVYFKLLQYMIATQLNIQIGSHTHFVSSMHLYDRDYKKAKLIVRKKKLLNNFEISYEKLLTHLPKLKNIKKKENLLKFAEEKGIIYENKN